MFLAGLPFAWLRLRSGSLLAPVLLHLATNSRGTVAAVVGQALTRVVPPFGAGERRRAPRPGAAEPLTAPGVLSVPRPAGRL